MKKIMSIFSVVLFAFALTLSSCGESNADKESVECSADCAKYCCKGCKATEGDKKCIKLEDGTMPCCAVNSDNEGGGVEADAKKMCDMRCRGTDLMKEAIADPTNTYLLTEAEEYAKKAEEFIEEMGEKYEDDEDDIKQIIVILETCCCD